MLCRATQDGQVIVKSSDKTWSIGGRKGRPFQYSCCENNINMNSMKKQKDMTQEHEHPAQKVSSVLMEKKGGQLLIAPERMKWLGQSRNDAHLWLCLVVRAKPGVVKSTVV